MLDGLRELGIVGGSDTRRTATVNDLLSLKGGVPLSVTFTVIRLVLADSA